MLTTKLMGGLGNYLFQIATTVSLAEKYNDQPIFNFDSAKQVHRNINLYTNNILRKVKTGTFPFENIYNEPKFSYNEIPYKNNMMLNGYFQSEKYFDRELILDLFSMDNCSNDYILSKYKNLLECETISVHVRRGDYLNRVGKHPVCDMSYYNNTFEYFNGDCKFIVFSDDIDWCKHNIKGENIHYSPFTHELQDLLLISSCKNKIIANSSFSWWSSYLSECDGITIAPKKWFGVSGPQEQNDIIPEEWIKI